MNDRDIFYDTAKLSRPEQEIVLRKAHSICERWWFDKLDCLESFARQQVKGISFEDAIGHFVEGALMNVIHRRQILPLDEPYLEVGFRSMELPVDYFLWIIVPMKRAELAYLSSSIWASPAQTLVNTVNVVVGVIHQRKRRKNEQSRDKKIDP